MPADAAPQLLHAMLPVADLGRSLEFYSEHFGLTEIRRISFPEIPRTLVFIGSAEAGAAAMQLELWHEPGAADCQQTTDVRVAGSAAPTGSGEHRRGHIGIAVVGIDAFVSQLAAHGVKVLQPPAELRPGGRRIAMIADPDGHEIELLAAG